VVQATQNPQGDNTWGRTEGTLNTATTNDTNQTIPASTERLLLAANYLQPQGGKDGQAPGKESGQQEVAKPPVEGDIMSEEFQGLDSEAETLLKEVLDLSSDLAIVDEQLSNPAKNQLLVLVTLEPTRFFDLDYVELTVDGETVAAHPYNENEIKALLRGGGHRLYLANLPAGLHELTATFVGKIPKDPDYQRGADFSFISGVNRTVIELYVNSSEKSGFPQLTIREWN
jgi:hypothetical protein